MSLPGSNKYRLITSKDYQQMAEDVSALMREGWHPWGAPFHSGDGILHQAMVAEEVLNNYVDAIIPRVTEIARHYRGR